MGFFHKTSLETTRTSLETTAVSNAAKPTSTSDYSTDDDFTYSPSPKPHPEASSFLVPHVVMTILAFGLVFPVGMTLAKRSRFVHVSLQVLGFVIAFVGIIFGKLGWSGSDWRTGKVQIVISGKYDLTTKLHQSLGWVCFILLFVQMALGPARVVMDNVKRHGRDAAVSNFGGKRKLVNQAHFYLAWILMILAYTLAVTGVSSLAGTCAWDGVSGCISKLVVGSTLMWYAAFGLLRLLHPRTVKQTRQSEELYASILITGFGIAATALSVVFGDPPFSHACLFLGGGILGICVEASHVFRGKNPVIGTMLLTLGLATAFSTNTDPYAASENDYAAVILLYFGYLLAVSGLCQLVAVSVRPGKVIEIVDSDDEEAMIPPVVLAPQPPPAATPSYESVPRFLHLFFLFLSGALMIGSSSGSPPRWAWLARIDSVGYGEVYLASAMMALAWIVLLGALNTRIHTDVGHVMMERREEEDEIQQPEYARMDDADTLTVQDRVGRASSPGLRSRSTSPNPPIELKNL